MTKTGPFVLSAHVRICLTLANHRDKTTCLHHAGLVCDTDFSVFSHAFGCSLLVTCDWQVCHLTWSRCWTNVACVSMVVLSTALP